MIAALSVAAILVAIYIPATIFQRVLFAWVAIGSALGPVILCRALGLTISTGRILPAIGAGFVAAVGCYLLPNTFSYPTTITLAMLRAGYAVGFQPIQVRERQGKSHIQR